MMWFFRHLWIFISYHIFLLNQVEGAIAIPPSNSAPLPLFCPSVCPSVCPSIGLLTTFSGFCIFADKSLGRNGIELECRCFQMTYPWPTLMPMGIVVISCVRPSVQPSMGLGLCIAYKALGRNGLQFGMLMYPNGLHSAFNTLVDTGDICCHYWQHILVVFWNIRLKLEWNSYQNTKLLIHENAFENVVCEILAILSSGILVKVEQYQWYLDDD